MVTELCVGDRIAALNVGDIVEVDWVDSHQHYTWQDAEALREAINNMPLSVHTAGYVFHHNFHSLAVALSKSDSNNVSEVIVIPVEAITAVKVLHA